MNKQEAIQAQIDEIMDYFEFDDVAKWMEHDGWKWVDSEYPVTVPMLRMRARELLREAAAGAEDDGWPYRVATGGLEATAYIGREDGIQHIHLGLRFGYTADLHDATSFA